MTDKPETWTTDICPYGEDLTVGAGCVKPVGHDGDHSVTPGIANKTTVIHNLAWPSWNPTSESHGVSYDKAAELADALVAETLAPVMQIVTDYVIESNDIGGIDCNDLADRLRTAGYPLVGDDDHEAPDDDPAA